jgi:hypothetical protein
MVLLIMAEAHHGQKTPETASAQLQEAAEAAQHHSITAQKPRQHSSLPREKLGS